MSVTPSVYYQRLAINDTAGHRQPLSDPGAGVYRNGNVPRDPSTDPFWLGALKVDWLPNADTHVYLGASKGFRTGCTNVGIGTICESDLAALGLQFGPDGIHHAVPSQYSSDSLWSYEIGTKNTLLDRRLQINGSIYFVNWNNIPAAGLTDTTTPTPQIFRGNSVLPRMRNGEFSTNTMHSMANGSCSRGCLRRKIKRPEGCSVRAPWRLSVFKEDQLIEWIEYFDGFVAHLQRAGALLLFGKDEMAFPWPDYDGTLRQYWL